MAKKKRGGWVAQNQTGGPGGGGNQLSKEKLAALDVLAERKDIVKHVTKQIKKKGLCVGATSHGETPAPSYLQSLMGCSSDSSSDSGSSSDDDKKTKKKRKKKKAALAAVESKFAEMETKIKELEAATKASEALQVAVETHLTPTKATKEPATLDRSSWDELKRRSKPVAAPVPGLLSPLFDEPEGEKANSAQDFLVVLEKKLNEANEDAPFEGKPGKVGAKAEAGCKKLASKLAEVHFPGKDTTSTEFTVLIELKDRFIGANSSRNPDTILAALLRSLTSRRVDLSGAEAGL